jgi:hypothetical protein
MGPFFGAFTCTMYEPKELGEAYRRMPDFHCWDSARRVFIKPVDPSEPGYPIVVRPLPDFA